MAGEEDPDLDDGPCPLCGGPAPAARVTLAKRRLDASAAVTTARGADGEASALRESLARQRRAVAGLQADLDAERAAAADAASEAMSMIVRLQRDKSEALMEARQYRRFAEERFAHDAAEADALRAALVRRDAAVGAMSARLRECQARLLQLGFEAPPSLPPPLPSPSPAATGGRRALFQDHHHAFADDDDDDYPSSDQRLLLDHPAPADVGTPRTHHLLNRMPGHEHPDTLISNDGFGFSYHDDYNVALSDEYTLYATTADRDSPDQEDERVYTVDTVPGVPVAVPSWSAEEEEKDEEVQKLKARLQALEADRESMRHAIMSMGDEKAQVVLLREIAQQLCKEGAMFPPAAVPMKVHPRLQPVVAAQQRKVARRRRSSFVKVFIVTLVKWIASIFCWRRKSNRIKYPIGLCGSNVGLMLVLDRYPKQRRRRFIKRI